MLHSLPLALLAGTGDFRMEPDISEYGFKFHMNDVNATSEER